MKEKPILLSKKMVRAILSGKKTQIRRVVKPQPENDMNFLGWGVGKHDSNTVYFGKRPVIKAMAKAIWIPGDRLYVRETYALVHPIQIAEGRFSLCPSDCDCGIYPSGEPSIGYKVVYRADGELPPIYWASKYPYRTLKKNSESDSPDIGCQDWHPSIHMPKRYARIWLEVTNIRVQRLQDISGEEAKAEGSGSCSEHVHYNNGGYYRRQFEGIWRSLYGDDPVKGWDANPWNWVIEFKRIERPEGEK